MITRENINQVLAEASVPRDRLHVDRHRRNDYWVWDAISVTSPKVVIIETHIELGMNNIVIPYDKDYVIRDGTRTITALRLLLWV